MAQYPRHQPVVPVETADRTVLWNFIYGMLHGQQALRTGGLNAAEAANQSLLLAVQFEWCWGRAAGAVFDQT